MFRFTGKPSSGSHSQYFAKIIHLVQCVYIELVQDVASVMAAYYDLCGVCAVLCVSLYSLQHFSFREEFSELLPQMHVKYPFLSTRYSCQVLIKFYFSRKPFEKYSNSKCNENRISLFHRAFQFTMCNGPTNALTYNKTSRHTSPHQTSRKTNACMLPHYHVHHI
jgi:hypothetical protein